MRDPSVRGHWGWTRGERTWGCGRGGERSYSAHVTPVHPLLSALGGPLCPFNQKAQRKAPGTGWSFKRQLSNFAHKLCGRYRKNPLVWNTRQKNLSKGLNRCTCWCSLQVTYKCFVFLYLKLLLWYYFGGFFSFLSSDWQLTMQISFKDIWGEKRKAVALSFLT